MVGVIAAEAGAGFSAEEVATVEAYRQAVGDVPGIFQWIAKEQLAVNTLYQRPLNEYRALQIARRWSWAACGALGVVQHGFEYMLFDGQHRKCAADMLPDITHLPCLVWRATNLQDEARAFIDANTVRGPMRAIERFHAEVIAGDPAALKVKELVEGIGLTVGAGDSSTIVGCVGALKDLVALPDAKELIQLIQANAGDKQIHSAIVRGVHAAQSFLRRQNMSLLKNPHRRKFTSLSREDLLDEIARGKGYHKRSGNLIEAYGIIKKLNETAPTGSVLPLPELNKTKGAPQNEA